MSSRVSLCPCLHAVLHRDRLWQVYEAQGVALVVLPSRSSKSRFRFLTLLILWSFLVLKVDDRDLTMLPKHLMLFSSPGISLIVILQVSN